MVKIQSKKIKQETAPIFTKCLRIKENGINNDNNMDDQECINDNDDEKSIIKATNSTQQTFMVKTNKALKDKERCIEIWNLLWIKSYWNHLVRMNQE